MTRDDREHERNGRQPQDVAGRCPALAQTTGPSLQTMIGLCTVALTKHRLRR